MFPTVWVDHPEGFVPKNAEKDVDPIAPNRPMGIAIENGPVEIVSFPSYNMVIFQFANC